MTGVTDQVIRGHVLMNEGRGLAARVRATPLLRAKAKITVNSPYAASRRLIPTAILTVNLTMALKSGVALRIRKSEAADVYIMGT